MQCGAREGLGCLIIHAVERRQAQNTNLFKERRGCGSALPTGKSTFFTVLIAKEMLNTSVQPDHFYPLAYEDSGRRLWQQCRHLIICSLIVSSASDRRVIKGEAFRPRQSDGCSQTPLWPARSETLGASAHLASSTPWSVCNHMWFMRLEIPKLSLLLKIVCVGSVQSIFLYCYAVKKKKKEGTIMINFVS